MLGRKWRWWSIIKHNYSFLSPPPPPLAPPSFLILPPSPPPNSWIHLLEFCRKNLWIKLIGKELELLRWMMMFFWAAGRDKNENEDVTSCMFLWADGGGEGDKNFLNCLLINVIRKGLRVVTGWMLSFVMLLTFTAYVFYDILNSLHRHLPLINGWEEGRGWSHSKMFKHF